MTDLAQVLPDFPVAQYARLLPAVEKSRLTVTDLLTLDVPDIGKRTQLPLLDIKRLCNAILAALHADLGVDGDGGGDGDGEKKQQQNEESSRPSTEKHQDSLRQTGAELLARPWRTISTLDTSLDAALGGGIPTGSITEITGESGAGKTQFLLTLLLSVQLPPPRGLGRPALYISTEAALSTKRLAQILAQNPALRTPLGDDDGNDDSARDALRPSLDRVISTVTPDLESQDHILTYQVPVEVARRNIGLIVLDSVAANYRAEFERGTRRSGGSSNNMAARGAELARLGHLLRELARKHDLAVVVANQVADRFTGSDPLAYLSSSTSTMTATPRPAQQQQQRHNRYGLGATAALESPLASRSRNIVDAAQDVEPSSSTAELVIRSSMPEPPPQSEDYHAPAPAVFSLDHQQRWFTGWGDDPDHHRRQGHETLKTPSLGLVWSTQIATRIALFRRPAYGPKVVVTGENNNRDGDDYDEYEETANIGAASLPYIRSWRRYMKVVFAPHVPGTGPGIQGAVEFEVVAGGLRGVERKARKKKDKEKKGGGGD